MNLRVFNTATRKKEPFTPLHPNQVRMYVCGPTVYDLAHLGHARCYVVWDTVVRYLRFTGLDVTYVRNYTDIDDKIIERAAERNQEPSKIAKDNIQAFDEDMGRLGVERPDLAPKVTEHMDSIVSLVEELVEAGAAYEAGGDVYFSVKSFPAYGKLSGRRTEKMRAGARVEPGEKKRDPLDFVLWKAAKPGEPSWDSPWGSGRPGWHIECSAMAMVYLGETLDIHAGGADLVFPHHENEIAQSEVVTKKPFARYWMHNGFVNINEEKMSKSLGNFFTVRDLLDQFDPEVIRYLLLSVHYRSPINFADSALWEARKRVRYQYETLARVSRTLDRFKEPSEMSLPAEWTRRFEAIREGFVAAMDDDLNTAGALGSLSDAFVFMNELCDGIEAGTLDGEAAAVCLGHARAELLAVVEVLGLVRREPGEWLDADDARGAAAKGIDSGEVERLLDERAAARRDKDFARADAIRDELAAKGVRIKDTPLGTEWSVG